MAVKLKRYCSFDGVVELIITVVLPLGVIFNVYNLPESAGYVPMAMSIIILSIGVFLVLTSDSNAEKESEDAGFLARILMVLGIFLAFWLAATFIGFYVSTAFLLFVFYFVFSNKDKTFSPVKGMLYTLITTGILYGLFHELLRVMTPQGLLI